MLAGRRVILARICGLGKVEPELQILGVILDPAIGEFVCFAGTTAGHQHGMQLDSQFCRPALLDPGTVNCCGILPRFFQGMSVAFKHVTNRLFWTLFLYLTRRV